MHVAIQKLTGNIHSNINSGDQPPAEQQSAIHMSQQGQQLMNNWQNTYDR